MERKKSIRRPKQKPPFSERAKDGCRKFTAFMFSNVGIILLVVLYIIAGSFMFRAIEGNAAIEKSEEMINKRRKLADRLWDISCCKVNTFNKTLFHDQVATEIINHQKAIISALRTGWQGPSDLSKKDLWNFSASFLYSLTVITTIGYGNISPKTKVGKIATIFYAIIGMPLFLLYLSNIGDILAKSFKWIYAKLCLCRVCPGVSRRRAIRERSKIRAQTVDSTDSSNDLEDIESMTTTTFDEEEDIENQMTRDSQTVTVPITVSVMVMVSYILFGSFLFSKWEQWENLDGSYFCFISLSSIGFGDIVPGFQYKGEDNVFEVSFILCSIYLLLGMALIAMCFNLMQEQVIYKIRSIKSTMRRCFRCR